MLKGKIQIDLHDVVTGEDERIIHHNMVTNALKDFIQIDTRYGTTFPYDDSMPLTTQSLGGLLLFDGALQEDVANTIFPSDVHLVGYAGQSVHTDTLMQGSINSVESGAFEDGYRHVWDFGTSQANGTIASLSLTHNSFGNSPYLGTMSGNPIPLSVKQGVPIHYDRKKQLLYTATYTQSEGKVTIYRRKCPLFRLGLNDSLKLGITYATDQVKQIEAKLTAQNASSTLMLGGDGYVYWTNNGYFSSKVGIFRFKISEAIDPNHQTKAEILCDNKEMSGIRTSTSAGSISKGYYYVNADGKNCVYRINLSNFADIYEFPTEGKPLPYTLPNGGAMVSDGGHWKILYPDKTIVTTDIGGSTTGSYNQLIDNAIVYEKGNTEYIRAFRGYLATIFNLPSAVQKKSTQVMKITYTITDIPDAE